MRRLPAIYGELFRAKVGLVRASARGQFAEAPGDTGGFGIEQARGSDFERGQFIEDARGAYFGRHGDKFRAGLLKRLRERFVALEVARGDSQIALPGEVERVLGESGELAHAAASAPRRWGARATFRSAVAVFHAPAMVVR